MDDYLEYSDSYSETKHKEERRWRTQDGREIPLSVMSSDHIKNALSFLKRKGFISRYTLNFYLTCSMPTGEHAQDAFWQEFDEITKRPISAWIDAFEGELERRGINNESLSCH